MSEQWFLDLDGVRSGPYQTSEVMSLVAEGEILPHHQIATDLKSQKWMTILEWRLNQNRSTEPKKEPYTSVPPAKVSPAQEKPIEPAMDHPVEKPAPVLSTPKPVETHKPPEKHAETHAAPPTAAPTPSNGKPKRDPMAEMFDMLQDTKQKREVKSQQSHAQAHAATQSPSHSHTHVTPPHLASTPTEKASSSKSNWGKTIFVGAIITVVGFALGQFFQHQGQKPVEPNVTNSTPTPAPSTSPEAVSKTIQENGKEIREVRTDKMIIRAQVPPSNNAAASPSPEHTKDIQELKDLKKELLELKALKEEIRGTGGDTNRPTGPANGDNQKNINNYDNDQNNGDSGTDENGNPVSPNEDTHY